ncbi:hypothetical protein HPB51_022756 [Rhipicephalus microplus]|uniref:Uncharacterized protein n=1 Tax=Rhipicephalus microplus TaxID=6941 RepID=A0A9J6EJ60_RHIMP|nr:hypothetical protein HPB51_022756 [Rhipicephalus microplus]
MKKNLKEVCRGWSTALCFVVENVVYRLNSEDNGYQQVVRHCSFSRGYLLNHQTSHHERFATGSEKRSVAGPQQYKASCNKDKDASDASVIAVTRRERCASKATTGAAWRVLIYDCRSWTYGQVCHDSARKDASTRAALEAVTTRTTTPHCLLPSQKNHPTWLLLAQVTGSSTLAAEAAAASTVVYAAAANRPCDACELSAAQATPGDKVWGSFLAIGMVSVGPTMEALMSSEDYKTGNSCCVALSDADLAMPYTRKGSPASKPSRSWPAESGVAVGPPVQEQLLSRGHRDSLSFYEFPLNIHHAALRLQPHSLIMEIQA